MHGLHKNLDWLSRWLFDVSGIPFGPPIHTVDISREPFRWREVRESYVTVVGVATLNLTTPPQRQRLFVWGSLSGANGFAVNDDLGMTMILGPLPGLAYPLWSLNNTVAIQLNGPIYVIHGRHENISLPGGHQAGVPRAVLVGPGDTLQFTHNSSVAGNTVNFRGLCIDLPEWAPFPPVF